MPRYYPLCLDLTHKLCLVVGGGPVAERKVRGLLEAEARIRVVSLTLSPGLSALAQESRIEVILAPYDSSHLANCRLVFAATNQRAVNARVAQDAAEAGVWANVTDVGEQGDFIVPSVLRRGSLCISVTTGGNNPLLAARLIEEFETRFGPEYAAFVELLGQMRSYIKEGTEDPALRRAVLIRLLEEEAELLALLRAGESAVARSRAEGLAAALLTDRPGPIVE